MRLCCSRVKFCLLVPCVSARLIYSTTLLVSDWVGTGTLPYEFSKEGFPAEMEASCDLYVDFCVVSLRF